MTNLQKATIRLNEAIDAYWMDHLRGLGLTGMGEHHMIRITDAQRRCREALEEEGERRAAAWESEHLKAAGKAE